MCVVAAVDVAPSRPHGNQPQFGVVASQVRTWMPGMSIPFAMRILCARPICCGDEHRITE